MSSQSKSFLSDIKKISTTSPTEVTIELNKPNVAILKVLSRDQLGIVPDGWTFDIKSSAPFIGTGPYNLVKIDASWFLVKNIFFKRNKIPIEKWRLIYFNDKNFSIPSTLPDVAPDITNSVLKQVYLNSEFKSHIYDVTPKFGFTQTTFWVHPTSELFQNSEKRKLAQAFLNEIIADYCTTSDCSRATGMIPLGIMGSLNQLPTIPPYKPNKVFQNIKIAAPAGIFNDLFSPKNIEKISRKYYVKIKLFLRSPGELKQMQSWNPDIVAGSWAGGFNDPTGFLSLLSGILG